MSMEAHVFFRGKLPAKAALSRAMKELSFPFSITPSTGSLEQQSGFMPMKRRGEETGVEFDVYDDYSSVEEFADVGVDAGFECRASLRWGGFSGGGGGNVGRRRTRQADERRGVRRGRG